MCLDGDMIFLVAARGLHGLLGDYFAATLPPAGYH